MFQPPAFAENRPEVLHDLMQSHPFASIVSAQGGTLTGDHVPLVLHRDQGRLEGHFSRANPLFQNAQGPLDVMVIFQGPHAYVSPNWYPSKQDHGKTVPTWNYMIAQAHGVLRFTNEPKRLMQHLNDLTTQHEGARENPWVVSDAPPEYIAQQLRALVGFEIEITALTGNWKLSQNKTDSDANGVVDGLSADGSAMGIAIANAVKSNR